MGKGDPTKDYYAALELTSSASEAEIRKQYHKLALLYHPDRNAGKEAEFAPRFQDIQEAYEVLNDPEEKGIYDNKRKRGNINSSKFTRPEPPKRSNPYPGSSNFPPPPRRNPPGHAPDPPPASMNGANRYTSWERRPPPRPAPTSSEDVDERARAWQSMRGNQQRSKPPGQQKYKVPPPYQGQQRPVPVPPTARRESPRRRATGNQSPPRSAYEEMNRATAKPKKNGFDPTLSSGQDEGPASGPSQYRIPRTRDPRMYGFSPNAIPSDDPPRSSSGTRRTSGSEYFGRQPGDDIPFAEGGPKEKTPYPANMGERTHFSGVEDFRRTASSVDTTRLGSHIDPQDPRRRSDHGHFAHVPAPTFEINNSDSSASEDGPPSKQWENAWHPHHQHRRQSGSSRPRPNTDHQMRDGYGSDSDRHKQGPSVRFGSSPHLSESMAPSSDSELRTNHHNRRKSSPQAQSPRSEQYQANRPPRSQSHPDFSKVQSQDQYSTDESEDEDRSHHNKPQTSEPPPRPPKEAEFSADKWQKNLAEENWAARWADGVRHVSPTRPSLSTRQSKGSNISHASGRGADATPITPQTEALVEREDGLQSPSSRAQQTSRGDGDPMDVDTEPVVQNKESRTASEEPGRSTQSARGVHVEPSRPEWRDSARNAPKDASRDNKDLPKFHPANQQPSRPAPTEQPEHPVQSSQNRPPSGLDTMPIEFTHVSPFDTPKLVNGRKAAFPTLKADLGAELPFKSQASPLDPTINHILPGLSDIKDLPHVPKAPPCPTRMTHAYMEEFFTYVSEYYDFYAKMLSKLQSLTVAQQAFTQPGVANPYAHTPLSPTNGDQSMAKGSNVGIMHWWLSATGEAHDKKGWPTFFAQAKQAAQLRRHLDVASERHMTALEAHERLREREREKLPIG